MDVFSDEFSARLWVRCSERLVDLFSAGLWDRCSERLVDVFYDEFSARLWVRCSERLVGVLLVTVFSAGFRMEGGTTDGPSDSICF